MPWAMVSKSSPTNGVTLSVQEDCTEFIFPKSDGAEVYYGIVWEIFARKTYRYLPRKLKIRGNLERFNKTQKIWKERM